MVIRNIEASLHMRLKAQASAQGRSMEVEAGQLLRQGLASDAAPPGCGFGDATRALFAPLGGLDLPQVERDPIRRSPRLLSPGAGRDTTGVIVLDSDIISELVKPEPLAAAVARANAQPIAAIARAGGAGVIATRNTQDFDGCGVALVNPWLPEAIIGGPPA